MNNPPAFPTGIITDGKGKIIGGSNGMTLRDYFAARALQGFMANKSNPMHFQPENDANWAYSIADAMLAAREKA